MDARTLGATLFGLLGTAGLTAGCLPEDEPQPVLEHAYLGSLELRFTQDLPPIQASARMDVAVDPYGAMTFSPGSLSYEGEQEEDGVRLKRSGQVQLRPTGHWFDQNDQDWFEVQEHATGEERLQHWAWDDDTKQWVQVLDQPIPIAWNGGLAFGLAEAVLAGATVESSTGLGRARWTLVLLPALE